MIWAWIETSRALIGSSATMRSGFESESPGHPDPLALAARELVGVADGEVGVQPDRGQEVTDPLATLLLRTDLVDVERLADDPGDVHPRVQAGVRILEDHLHPAAHLAQGLAVERGQVDPVEGDRPEVGL